MQPLLVAASLIEPKSTRIAHAGAVALHKCRSVEQSVHFNGLSGENVPCVIGYGGAPVYFASRGARCVGQAVAGASFGFEGVVDLQIWCGTWFECLS